MLQTELQLDYAETTFHSTEGQLIWSLRKYLFVPVCFAQLCTYTFHDETFNILACQKRFITDVFDPRHGALGAFYKCSFIFNVSAVILSIVLP